MSIFDKLKTINDYRREEEEFQMNKQMKQAQTDAWKSRAANPGGGGGNLPAPLQLANEYKARLEAGDLEGANQLAQFAKIVDKGVVMTPEGYQSGPGYDELLATRKGLTSGADEQAKQIQKTAYEPAREVDIAQKKADIELKYAAPLTNAKKTADINAVQIGELNKKADGADVMTSLTDKARTILKRGDATGSVLGTAGAYGKKIFGMSDSGTQDNAALDVVAGNMVSNVPRMEGPQGVADLIFYKEQAGKVNDKTVPLPDRLAALDAIDGLNAKYTDVNTPRRDAQENPQEVVPGVAPKETFYRAEEPRDAHKAKERAFNDKKASNFKSKYGLE